MSFWTERRVDELRRMWFAGSTGAAIALKLGCSRDAALGKLFRLGYMQTPAEKVRRRHNQVRREARA